ncbi:hypothetical protein [Prosthecobacter sp.]|uniref:hypothetical protein n=1 Tax=Prosthecobacter sp. TaxID=1965333 RepID=UPI003784ACBC
MKRILCFLALATTFWVASPVVYAQPGTSKAGLDALIDWDSPWSLTPDKFKEIATAASKKKSDRAYSTRMSPSGKLNLSIGDTAGSSSGSGRLSLFGGEVRVQGISASFDGDKATGIGFQIGDHTGTNGKKASPAEITKLKAELGKLTGDTAPKPYQQEVGGGHAPVTGQQWIHRNYLVQMFEVYQFGPNGSSGTGVFNVWIVPSSS